MQGATALLGLESFTRLPFAPSEVALPPVLQQEHALYIRLPKRRDLYLVVTFEQDLKPAFCLLCAAPKNDQLMLLTPGQIQTLSKTSQKRKLLVEGEAEKKLKLTRESSTTSVGDKALGEEKMSGRGDEVRNVFCGLLLGVMASSRVSAEMMSLVNMLNAAGVAYTEVGLRKEGERRKTLVTVSSEALDVSLAEVVPLEEGGFRVDIDVTPSQLALVEDAAPPGKEGTPNQGIITYDGEAGLLSFAYGSMNAVWTHFIQDLEAVDAITQAAKEIFSPETTCFSIIERAFTRIIVQQNSLIESSFPNQKFDFGWRYGSQSIEYRRLTGVDHMDKHLIGLYQQHRRVGSTLTALSRLWYPHMVLKRFQESHKKMCILPRSFQEVRVSCTDKIGQFLVDIIFSSENEVIMKNPINLSELQFRGLTQYYQFTENALMPILDPGKTGKSRLSKYEVVIPHIHLEACLQKLWDFVNSIWFFTILEKLFKKKLQVEPRSDIKQIVLYNPPCVDIINSRCRFSLSLKGFDTLKLYIADTSPTATNPPRPVSPALPPRIKVGLQKWSDRFCSEPYQIPKLATVTDIFLLPYKTLLLFAAVLSAEASLDL